MFCLSAQTETQAPAKARCMRNYRGQAFAG